jgi:hypothetical protein
MSRKELEALGSHRESLDNNPLLVQSQLGKPRSRCFTLPGPDFTYGMKNICVDGGAVEAMSNWYVSPGKPVNKPKELERDFVTLNKASVQAGLTTAYQQSQFRATHDIRRKPLDSVQDKSGKSIKFPPDMTFGISTRPSTPIFELLRYKYQDKWLQDMKESERKCRESDTEKKRQLGNIQETKASMLRKYVEPVDPGPMWHMKQFTNVSTMLMCYY